MNTLDTNNVEQLPCLGASTMETIWWLYSDAAFKMDNVTPFSMDVAG